MIEFKTTRIHFQKLNRTADEFFGDHSDVNKTLADINKTLDDVTVGIPDFAKNLSRLKIHEKITPKDIKNISLTLSSGKATWTKQKNTIKHSAEVTGVYRLSVFSAAEFSIFTTYPWRHETEITESVRAVLNSGTEETFILDPTDKK